jgi:RHS repeat-associated protein
MKAYRPQVRPEEPTTLSTSDGVGRYYDPQTGSFLTSDPLVASTGKPYSYAEDNPVNERDPSGLATIGDCAGGSLALPRIGGFVGTACLTRVVSGGPDQIGFVLTGGAGGKSRAQLIRPPSAPQAAIAAVDIGRRYRGPLGQSDTGAITCRDERRAVPPASSSITDSAAPAAHWSYVA